MNRPANDNHLQSDPAFAIGETVDVMTTGEVVEIIRTAQGFDYLVRASKKDGGDIFIRKAEISVFEHEPIKVAA